MNDFAERASTDLAMQLFREGKVTECIECANKVISVDANDAAAYTILGAAYAQMRDGDMAIASFQKTLEIKPTPRAHFNLGKVYEDRGWLDQALQQYDMAVQMDQSYKQAIDAVARLTTMQAQATQAIDASMVEQTVAMTANTGPQPLTGGSEQTVYSGGAQPPLQAYEIPKFVNQSRPGGPDLRDLEMRAQSTEAKAQAAQKQMMKSGLLYGMVVGPLGLMAAFGILHVFGAMGNILAVIIEGVVFGALVGLWIGFTCGDDIVGLKVGALLGGLAQGLPPLLHYSEAGLAGVIIGSVMGAFIGAVAGYFIGMMVEHSIGD